MLLCQGLEDLLYLFILLYWADSTADMCPGKKIAEIS